MTVVSPFFTFPNIGWWAQVQHADVVIFDGGEHFEKMTCRNRYQISGANNSILLSVPLVNGRNQHVPMKDVQIHNIEKWQVQHWRTLVSVYRRTPYFDYYEAGLKRLFDATYTHLVDFNRDGVAWIKKELKMNFEMQETKDFQKAYPAEITDLRSLKPYKGQGATIQFPKYYQVFEERLGFLPDLSILDLLFSEGPGAVKWLIGV